jgi:calcium permeable stress-gated cation channel
VGAEVELNDFIFLFSIRIFSIAAIVCLFGVLPANYFGRDMLHKQIPSESLEVFTIANVIEGSRWYRNKVFLKEQVYFNMYAHKRHILT